MSTEPSEHSADTLGLEPDEMRRLGYWVVDRVVDHLEHGHAQPVISTGTPAELTSVLGGPPPEDAGDAIAAMSTLVDVALSRMQHGDHPRFFARVPGPSSFAAILGEWLATGFNGMTASWGGGSGTTTVELVVTDWLRSLLGMPAGTEGVLTSGGSLANITGLVAARHAMGPGVTYLSDQTHSSIWRGLLAMGVPPDQLRVLVTDDRYRMPVDVVADAIAQDRREGRHPAIVIATAGSTNTGAVDPLPGLADLCAFEDVWLHVDGAYGAPAALCEKGRAVLAGIERSDSLVLDPHKWLFQPYDIGSLLVRRPGALEAAFRMTPEYLIDVTARNEEVDMRDRSLELSRRARAIKVWLTFRTYGATKIRSAIERGIELAEHAERVLRGDERWEVVTPAQLGIVTFAASGSEDRNYAGVAASLTADGFAAVTSTTLHGRSALRLCTINPRSTEDDIDSTIDRLATLV
jgi:aromatic-L-amino-acid decarboxylase